MLWVRGLYVFTSVRVVVANHYKSSTLFVIKNCGHVVNVEQPYALILKFYPLNTAQ
jgi:hypothetical protein